jgi:acetoin utilization deacetylase AcuC-like enzyme
MASLPRTASLSTASRVPRGHNRRAGRRAGRATPVTRAASDDEESSSSTWTLDPTTLETSRLIYATAPALDHARDGHPESNARVPAILDALLDANLTPEARPGELALLNGFKPASAEAVMSVHTKNYVRGLDMLAKTRAPLDIDASPTYLTTASYEEALNGVGAALALVDAVVLAARAREALSGAAKLAPAGFGLCRPPGHHALPRGAMGFCLFGTAAAAARHAQTKHSLGKVMIFDFDVHHGNGTNDIFRDDPSVLFISAHEDGSFPGTGKATDVGDGDGVGATINVPLPPGSGDAAALAVFDEVVAPAAARFQPDIVLVSAGYDAHWRDPLAGLHYRTGTYHRLSKRLKALADDVCGGKIVFLLEGGYDLVGLSEGVTDSFRALLGDASGEKSDAIDGLVDADDAKVRKVLREATTTHQLA